MEKIFKAPLGFEDERVQWLSGTDVPGTTPFTDEAKVGSLYADVFQKKFYQKILEGPGTDKWIKFTIKGDISPPGAVVFISDIQPAVPTGGNGTQIRWHLEERHVESAITNVNQVSVTVIAEGGAVSYKPQVNVRLGKDGVAQVVTLSEDAQDKRFYKGTIVLDMCLLANDDVDIIAEAVGGTSDSINVEMASGGPDVTSVTFGSYPPSWGGAVQTSLKSGDVISVTGEVDDGAIIVEAAGGPISSFNFTGIDKSGGDDNHFFTGTVRISGSSSGTVTFKGKNDFGTYGDNPFTSPSLKLDQSKPSISPIIVDRYPAGQEALKNSETATATATVTDYSEILYSFPNNELKFQSQSPTIYEKEKILQRINGDYRVSGFNYRIRARKESNGTESTKNGLVKIADIVPTAYLSHSSQPFRSSPTGEIYLIAINASQHLLSTPSLTAPEGSLSPISGSKSIWKTFLTVYDSSTNGTYMFHSLLIKGLAGREGNIITTGASYTIGGFMPRDLLFASFGKTADIGTFVADISKLRGHLFGDIGQPVQVVTFKAQDPSQNSTKNVTVVNSRSVNDSVYDAHGSVLHINDSDLAGQNATGTQFIRLEEIA